MKLDVKDDIRRIRGTQNDYTMCQAILCDTAGNEVVAMKSNAGGLI